MPVTAPQIANFNDCLYTMTKALGIHDGNYPDGSVVAIGAPYTVEELKKRLQDADYEIRILICESQDNPFRELYFKNADKSDWLPNNALIPAGVSKHSTALVKESAEAADETAKTGKLARNVSAIERVQENPEIYGSPKKLYYIHASRVLLGHPDALIQFDVPKLVITANTLYAPHAYKWGIIASAIVKCFVPGTNEAHRKYWAGVLEVYEREIEGRAMSLSEPEQLKRIGA